MEEIDGLKFKIGALLFFKSITKRCCFCMDRSGILISRRVGKTIGIEINPHAASSAGENAKINGIDNFEIMT